MEWPKQSLARNHCSKACYGVTCRVQNDGPDMPPLDKESISEDGYVALVNAIIRQASEDVTQYPPGNHIRLDAEKFFLSPYFDGLTGLELNGKEILAKLQAQPRKKRYNRRDD